LLLIQWDDALERPLCLPILTHRRTHIQRHFYKIMGRFLPTSNDQAVVV
jgi:hypothetical protein